MIVEWIWAQIMGFVGWLLSMFPTFDVPVWVDDLGGYLEDGIAAANGFHNWIPLVAIRNSLIWLLSVGAVVLTIRAVRILISHVSGGGGSAA